MILSPHEIEALLADLKSWIDDITKIIRKLS